jgi:phosphoribosyl-AMP cyclohydrolase
MELDFGKLDGLLPAIVQDYASREVLMLGFVNREAIKETLRSGDVTFYSRSRKKLWKKGEYSGHRLRVCELLVDCDADAILARVQLVGPGVCHEGYRSCFFRELLPDGTLRAIAGPTFDPRAVYGEEQKP